MHPKRERLTVWLDGDVLAECRRIARDERIAVAIVIRQRLRQAVAA
jgi:hypothetical protein